MHRPGAPCLISAALLIGCSLCFGADATPLVAHHLMGLDTIKRNAKGDLKIEKGSLQFTAGKTVATVPASSVTDIFSGEEVSQSGGTVGTLTKLAIPYGGGRALSLVLRNKLDVITVTYLDKDKGFHGAIFSLPKGQGEQLRTQLIAEGAHAHTPEIAPKPEAK